MQPPGTSAARLLAAALASLFLLGIQAGESPRGQHEDAVPSGRLPGFEPVDIAEEMEQIQRRKQRELEQQVDADRHYRTVSSEPRLRARYGSATWNLYEPYH